MKGLRLYKKEKLCSTTAIDNLFARGRDVSGALEYPLRAVWRLNPQRRSDASMAFVVSVPKKRLHHAVDRVAMRRRIRESYRLSRLDYPLAAGIKVDVAFIYVADTLRPYALIARAMNNLLAEIRQSLMEDNIDDDGKQE